MSAPPEMTRADRAKRAGEIAEAMGPGWRLDPDPNNIEPHLLGPDGERLVLTISRGWSGPDRATISIRGSVRGELHRFVPDGGHPREIHVSAERPAAAIAREIERRCLPRYREVLAAARASLAMEERHARDTLTLADLVAATLRPHARAEGGREVRNGSVEIDFGGRSKGTPVRGSVSVSGDEVTFRVRAESGPAMQLATVIRDMLDAARVAGLAGELADL